jgi:hypothetical protein
MVEKENVIVQINPSNYGHAIAQAVSRWLPTAAARILVPVQVMWDFWWIKWH